MRVAVLGATGMLGHQVYLKMRSEGHQTFAVVRKSIGSVMPYGIFKEIDLVPDVDFLNSEVLFRTLKKLQPEVVINCAGVTTRKLEHIDAAAVIEMNSVLPQKLSNWCEQNRSRFFQISTDCVFNGKSAPYSETSPISAQDLYGLSKALGEVKDSSTSVTIRCSIIGPELEAKTELFEWARAQNGKTIQGYSEVIYSGVTTLTLANVLAQLISNFKDLHGLYQVASEPISKFELLKLIKSECGLNLQIEKNSQNKSDKTLLSTHFEAATKISIPSWQQQLQDIMKQEMLMQLGKRLACF